LSTHVPLVRLPVGVVVERRRATSPWIEYVWQPVAVLAGIPEAAPWTEISAAPDAAQFFAGSVEIELYRSETAHYRDNLDSGAPALWVVLRPTGREPPFELKTVTADPAEGEGFTEPGTDLVEQVAMPESIRRAVAAFIAEHPAEHAFAKRERDRGDPEALGRRVPARKGRNA
jgi:uncharacterized protein DUF3305